jgi:hypothetical protein
VNVVCHFQQDIDHKSGVVGSFKSPWRVPATAWEVHPITEIVFAP